MSRPLTIKLILWATAAVLIVIGLFVRPAFLKRSLPVYGELADFVLTNQVGETVSLSALKGQVWVADVIYTRCPSQCIRMTYQMSQLQSALPLGKPVKLVSITSDPMFDTPPVLKNYALKNGAGENWIFLTGNKSNINRVAIDGMKLSIVENTPIDEEKQELFIHSTKFVLIDKAGQIRGYYTGDTPESRPQLLADLEALLRE